MRECKELEHRDPVQLYGLLQARRRWFLLGVVLFFLVLILFWSFIAQVPTDYANNRDHFKYGSIGSDSDSGIPYWIWWVLPEMFPQYLPEPDRFRSVPAEGQTARMGYSQFGFTFEEGKDLPIGFSKRRVGVERVGLNCAVCHVATVKVSAGMDPSQIYGAEPEYPSAAKDRVIVLGMPAIKVDLSKYLLFLENCAADEEFTTDLVLAAIAKRTRLGPIDRFIYKRAVPLVKETLIEQKHDFVFLRKNPEAGPGRVDTFNPYKYGVFKFPVEHFDNSIGTADFPSIWNQRAREGMQLHWDGNNTSVFERNISASLGAGATPVSLDMPRMLRVASWLGAPDPHRPLSLEESQQARLNPVPRPGELPVPKYPFSINEMLAKQGESIYREGCARCHDWQGESIGKVVKIDEINTDRERLDSFTPELAANQNTLGAGQWWRFHNFRKTTGYVSAPLDGLWARAPYLHNGSVPTLADLLNPPGVEPEKHRPKQFFRGDDEYDPVKVGFRSDRERCDDGRKLFMYDTSVRGNRNLGHLYGTDLSDKKKKALLEYLKTL